MSNKFSSSDIVAQFPIAPADMPKIATATTRPTYTSIIKFQEAINGQALAIPINDSDLGHLALVISAADYESVNNNVAFVAPTSPGPNPVHTGTATAAQIAETNRVFQVNANTFQVYQITRTHLRNQIINSTPDKYICALKHKITQYSNVTPLQLLTHLKVTYGQVTSDDLTANYARMTESWNPPTPIEVLFEQLKEGKEFAAEGNETFLDAQLMRLAYDNIKATGLFNEQCCEWRKKPAASKTYHELIDFFTECDTDRRQNETTSGSAGYSANAVREVVRDEFNSIIAEQAGTTPTMTQEEIDSLLSGDSNIQESPIDTANTLTKADMKAMFEEFLASNQYNTNKNRNRDRNKDKNKNEVPVAQGFYIQHSFHSRKMGHIQKFRAI